MRKAQPLRPLRKPQRLSPWKNPRPRKTNNRRAVPKLRCCKEGREKCLPPTRLCRRRQEGCREAQDRAREDRLMIDQRIVSMHLPQANYVDLQAGKDGILHFIIAPMVADPNAHGQPSFTVSKFDLKTRKTDEIAAGVSAFILSFSTARCSSPGTGQWFIQDSDKARRQQRAARSRQDRGLCRSAAQPISRCTARPGASKGTSSTTRVTVADIAATEKLPYAGLQAVRRP